MTGRSTDEWVATHPDQKIPPRVRLRVFARFNGICQETGRRINAGDEWDCDHEIALANGGKHREYNLRPVLRFAHRRKTAEDVSQRAKDDRIRKKHLGLHKSKNPVAGSRGTRFRKRMDGTVEKR